MKKKKMYSSRLETLLTAFCADSATKRSTTNHKGLLAVAGA